MALLNEAQFDVCPNCDSENTYWLASGTVGDRQCLRCDCIWRVKDWSAILFVGAEGLSELGEPYPEWIRQALPTDLERASKVLDPKVLSLDGIGRPYWALVVLPSAPMPIRLRAAMFSRVVRLEE